MRFPTVKVEWKSTKTRDAPASQRREAEGEGQQPRSGVAVMNEASWKVLLKDGYKPITQCAEVQMCLHTIADLVASMTVHLIQNTDKGDMRLKNDLSRKLDIEPSKHMTHQTFFHLLAYVMLAEGNQVTFPTYDYNGRLANLKPLKPSKVSFIPDGEDDYLINYGGRIYMPDEVCHFVLCPDPEQPWRGMGYTLSLQDVVKGIRQANATKQAIMESPAPSLIVKVDATDEDFSSPEGRKRMGQQYLDESENGKPWFVPAELFDVTTVKPLTINDLAIKTNLELDKRTVAAMFGVPSFLVGVGEFRRDEYNNFVSTRIMALSRAIEQELTKKLLYAKDLYWRFNVRALMAYDIGELVNAGAVMSDRMAIRRNEWRDMLGMTPDPEMEELLALENYVPADRLGDQKKLIQGGGKDSEADQE